MQRNRGNEAVRFCLKCKRNVYDIASLSTAEAEKLLTSADPVCVQVYRRADGKVMTRDCGGSPPPPPRDFLSPFRSPFLSPFESMRGRTDIPIAPRPSRRPDPDEQ